MNCLFLNFPNRVEQYLVCFLNPREVLTCSLICKKTWNVVNLIFKQVRTIAEKQCPDLWNKLENAGLSEKFIAYNFLSAHSQTESIHNIFNKISIEKVFLTIQIWLDILYECKKTEKINKKNKFMKTKNPLNDWPQIEKNWWKLSFFCAKNGNSIKEGKMNSYNTYNIISSSNLSSSKQITLSNKINKNIFFIKDLDLGYTGEVSDQKTCSLLPENSVLPKNIELFEQLEIISLKNRKFKFFPKELCKLNYTDLDVSFCSMETIGDDITFPENLEILDLSENNLTKLPDSLKLCKKLKHLSIHKNKFNQEDIKKFFFKEDELVFENLSLLSLSRPEVTDPNGFNELLEKIRTKRRYIRIEIK